MTAVVAALLITLGLAPSATATHGATGASIAGTVRNADGAGIAGVHVSVYGMESGGGGSAVTDVNGAYTVVGLQPDEYLVEFDAAGTGYASEYYDDATGSGGELVFLPVAHGEAVIGIDAVLERAVIVSGHVTDMDGAPLADAYVSLVTGDGGYGGEAMTDGHGAYVVDDVVPGTYTVRVEHWNYAAVYHPGVAATDGWEALSPPAGATRFTLAAGDVVEHVDVQLTVAGPYPWGPVQQLVASKDLTADRNADLVTVDAIGRLHINHGEGDGYIYDSTEVEGYWADRRVFAPGDWNGDGRNDLFSVTTSGGLFLHPGVGTSARIGTATQVGRGWSSYRVVPSGDMNGDSRADLLAIDSAGRLWLYPGTGSGGFGARSQVGSGWGGFQLHPAGDMNRDGRADILSIDSAGRMFFYAGRGGGSFARALQVGRGWNGPLLASGADFNGDGINDLMGRATDSTLLFYPGRLGGSFQAAQEVGYEW